VQGKTWLAMGDPVARDTSGTAGLIWQFKETADLHRGTPAFYQVATDHLPAYIDAGFALAKLGEDACVHLDHFTLQGGEGRKLRQTKAAAERAGLRFEIVPREQLVPLLPALKAVSDEWLAGRKSKEKGFSLGFWSDEYVSRFDCAVVRHGERVVAFANVWQSAKQTEFSVDLMRHVAYTPNGTMDYLFISLMEAARAEGFCSFNLGMSPLSGLSRHKLASLWSRCGGLVYSHGDQFYNFEGLRAFKSKFKPEWRPRYLAYPGGLSFGQILVDATALIASSPERAHKTKEAGK
jgi:phosphatidylglycerol lysyltransferase